MKYRYYIEGTEVFPKGEWSQEYRRNEGQIFFRQIIDSELTFMDADYDFITGLCCKIATFDIYCGGEIFWQGQFQYPYKVKFDADSCVVVLTPEVVDEYTCVMANYETEYPYSATGGGVQPEINDCAAGALHTLPFCYPLAATGAGTIGHINFILNSAAPRLNCGLTLQSSFLWEDDFPNGDDYAADYGTDNYITGATNRLNQIYLGTNTSFRDSLGGTLCDGDQYVTFKMFEELLRNWFNAYWFIDENGAFRIEHIYYFDPAFANSDYLSLIHI